MTTGNTERDSADSSSGRKSIHWLVAAAVSLVCVLVGWLLWTTLLGGRRGGGLAPPPNLVLITVDTLRADHLGCYGYSRPASPRIDHLAESGLVFERAISQAPWTLPSIATLFTSLYPREHGAIGAKIPLKRELTTLSETLQAAGYGTIAVVSHWFVGRRYGLDQGFDTFDQSLVRGEDGVTSPDLTEKALEYLGNVAGEPFFLWVHYFDPHFTYVRHPEFGFVDDPNGLAPARLTNIELRDAEPALADDAIPNPFSVDTVRAIYDEEIAYTDAAIGNLVDGINGMNFRRPIVTVFTADHGEYFMERGRFGHGRDVYDELVHVPLIVWGAIDERLQGLRIARTVEIASVAHTLAELARVGDNPFQGEDLLALPETPRKTRPSFSEGNYAWGTDERKIMVEWEGWKLIRNLDDDRFELYDLSGDPRERENRWDQDTSSREVVHTALQEALDRFARRQAVQAPSIILSPEEIERLNALGYVEN